jgi:nucleotide-binding universal stress UspA family protein
MRSARCSWSASRTPKRSGEPVNIHTILVATDFSAQARAAADWATALAGALAARVIVAHVYDLPIVGFPDGALLVDAGTATRLSEEAQAALDAEVSRIGGRGVKVEGTLKQGDPREVIPALAQTLGAGLVAAGSHGRRGVARALLGSLAESLVRDSTVPVVVIRTGGS